MRLALLATLLVVACDAGTPKVAPPPPKPPAPAIADAALYDAELARNEPPEHEPPPLTADDRDVIAAALLRFTAKPDTLADRGISGTKHYVMVEPGKDKLQLPPPYVSVTGYELMDLADKGTEPGFIHIYSVTVTGDKAIIVSGGDVMPDAARRSQPRECCCDSQDEFVRTRRAWKFSKNLGTVCS